MLVPKSILAFFTNIILCDGILRANTSSIFVIPSSLVGFITGELLQDAKALTLVATLLCFAKFFQRSGFKITMCYLDNEFETVIPIMHRRSYRFHIKIYPTEEHVSEIDWCIRTIKERARGIITTLPFKRIPQIILIHSVIFNIFWLNFLPPRNGVSNHLCPSAIILSRVQTLPATARLHLGNITKCMVKLLMI